MLCLRCYTEIDLGRIERNFGIYRGALSDGFEIIPVVKADAYGHGAVSVASRLYPQGVRLFAAATLSEAIALRKGGIASDILILGYTPLRNAEDIYKYGLTQTLVDECYTRELATATDKRLKVQYAIDTGMRRIGINALRPSVCERLIRYAAARFELTGIFTHLAVADGTDSEKTEFTRMQIKRFADIAVSVADLRLPFVHCLNTAGGIAYGDLPEGIGKFVRLGISLYGLAPSKDIILPCGIEPALSWYATVTSVRAVKRGENVGYGFGYAAERDGIIATLSVGYADGYSRAASNKAYVLINGQRAPVVGRVCMDQTMVDVSRVSHLRAGDVATLIGADGNERITADDLGEMLGTIGYEVVCGISARVERRYKRV